MISKTANKLTSSRYKDPTNELLVNYVNSGEAKNYMTAKKMGPALGWITGFSGLSGAGIGSLMGKTGKGAAVGLGVGAGTSGLALLLNKYRKDKAKELLDEPGNRRLLNKKLRELQADGVNIKYPNSINAYLRRQMG